MKTLCLLFVAFPCFAQQLVGDMAIKHAMDSKVHQAIGNKDKVLNLMRYLSTSVLFRNTDETNPNRASALPEGGVHPYEWDSIRTSEKMLQDSNGGSCGTIGLSAAAILRAGGIATDEIRIVGGVLNHHYMHLCPGGRGSRRKPIEDGTAGHIYLQVKIEGQWYLLNSTHNPLHDFKDVNSSAVRTYRSLMTNCQKKHQITGKPDPTTKNGREFLECAAQAKKAGLDRLKFEDLEITPFVSPQELANKMAKGPVGLPVKKFPSLVKWMGQGTVPEMIAFKSWKFEDYPVHTFQDRLNIVASGKKDDDKCRYARKEVDSITQYPLLQSSREDPPSYEDKKTISR